MDFNKLNAVLYQQSATYRFAKKPNDFDKGYMKISKWLADLCYYYEHKREQQELADEDEFMALINDYKTKINKLGESDYKKGLLKAIGEV